MCFLSSVTNKKLYGALLTFKRLKEDLPTTLPYFDLTLIIHKYEIVVVDSLSITYLMHRLLIGVLQDI